MQILHKRHSINIPNVSNTQLRLCFATTLLFLPAIVPYSVGAQNLLVNGGFESGSPQHFFPSTTGLWATDPALFVGNENGVTPLEGMTMMRFLYTYPDPPEASAAIGSDLRQLVEATSLAGATVRLTASCNRVTGDSQTDTEFRLYIRAYAGDLTEFNDNFPTAPPFIAQSSVDLVSDADPGTWETISLDWTIPVGTDYVSVLISARENIHNDLAGVEFDGHYADDIKLEIVAPTSVPQASAHRSWGEIKQSFR